MTRSIGTRVRGGLLASLAALSLAACSGRDDDKKADTGSVDLSVLGTPKKATGTPLRVGFVNDGKNAQLDNTGMWDVAEATAKYVNEYLGGVNGHVLTLVHCATNFAPAGGTACGATFKRQKVQAVLAGTTAYDQQVSDALGAETPIMALRTGSAAVLTGANRFAISNPLAQVGVQIEQAKARNLKKTASVLIDVPAAAAVGGIVGPVYAKSGLNQEYILISAKVADHTSRLQQAITAGRQSFSVNGSTPFFIADLKALRQLKFTGPIMVSLQSSDQIKQVAAAVPGGLNGMINVTGLTTDPNDKDVKIYEAIKQKYGAATATGDGPESGLAVVLSFVRALEGASDLKDAAAVSKALSTMKSVDQPLGGGIKIQCGTKPIAFTPDVCTTQYLTATFDKNNEQGTFKLGDVKPYL